MVKVSIVVPIYNNEAYLVKCLDSIIRQTLKEIEIICVDDGSTDSSVSILKSYRESDPRVKVITRENSGYGKTMNVGMEAATGEYIGIVESDDYIDRDMFAALYRTARKTRADIVKSDYYEFGDKIGEKYIMTPTYRGAYGKILSAYTNEEIYHFRMNTWTGIYRRDFLKYHGIKHNETPGASYQDNGFWFKTITLSERTVFMKGAFYHYRQDNPSSSINSRSKVYAMCEEYAHIERFLQSNPGLQKLHMGSFLAKKYHNYFYTYKRIAEEYRMDFLKRFAKEFNESGKRGELDKDILPKESMDILIRIMRDPIGFYYDDTIWELNRELRELSEKRLSILTGDGV